jgi:signal transduction histidine kinase
MTSPTSSWPSASPLEPDIATSRSERLESGRGAGDATLTVVTGSTGGDHARDRERTGGTSTAEQRLERLLAANRAIVGELSLPTVLRRVVEAARDLVGAHYAALGVIGEDGRLQEFIHLGADSDAVASISDLPQGLGVVGVLIGDPLAIRLPATSDDARFTDFPPMEAFLGVPIRSRNSAYGNLYLTGRPDGEFTAEDEKLVLAMAATAGIAIENARLYEESARREQWLEASAEISGVLLSPGGDRDPLQLILNRIKELADADVATLVVPVDDSGLLRVAVATGDGEAALRGMEYPTQDTLVALAMDTGRGVRVGALERQQGYTVHLSQVVDVGPVMAVPLMGDAGPHGAIMLGRRSGRRNFTTADLDLAEVFANQAALVRELVEARANQQRLAVLEDRDRIARDLHDHVIQRLYAAGLNAQSLAALTDDPAATARLDRLVSDLDDTIGQIRTSIFHLQAGEAGDPGLRVAILAVVGQVAPGLGFAPAVRFAGPVDTLVHGSVIGEIEAVSREGLTNVAKHAQASQVAVEVSADRGLLSVRISDDGVGMRRPVRSSGLGNLRQRAEGRGGSLTIEARPGGGTVLTWTIPIPD